MANTEFAQRVYHLVQDIPCGYVLTYGMVAALCGAPNNARQIGRLMTDSPEEIRTYRVVNAAGHTVPGWEEQRTKLSNEGITFKKNGAVDLKKHLWIMR